MTSTGIPTLSRKEALLLEMLLEHASTERYGLELVNSSGGGIKRGTVYVTLSRMEDKGYVTSRQEIRQPDAAGLARRLYRATGYGRRVYEIWQLAKDAAGLFANRSQEFS